MVVASVFFFNDTATTEIYTLSLHDALPIWRSASAASSSPATATPVLLPCRSPTRTRFSPCSTARRFGPPSRSTGRRSEEHTSELQSRQYLVCRLLLEKKKKTLLYQNHICTQ